MIKLINACLELLVLFSIRYALLKSLIAKERDSLFRELTLSYQEEGFSLKESRRLAKQETEEILSNSLDFVEDVITKSYK